MKLPKLLSAAALYERLHRGDNLLLLDVRNNEAFARLRIETGSPSGRGPDTLNLPYFLFLEEDTAATALAAIPAGRPIVVVCAHGEASEMVASRLRQAGHTAANLAGGMEAWARNSDLAFAHEDDFVAHLLGNLPALPPEYAEIKRVNAGLVRADPQQSSVLEMGRNVCALSSAYADDPASLVPR